MSPGGKIIRVRTDINWTLLVSVSFLLAVGLITLYSIEEIQIAKLGSSDVSFKSQLIYSLAGIIAGIIGYNLNPRFLRTTGPFIFYFSTALLIATYLFGTSVKGGVRWLYVGGISIQPSDITRLAIIIYIGSIFSSNKVGWNAVTLKVFLWIIAVTGLILFQPDYGSAMITFLVSLMMLFVLDMPLSMFLPGFAVSSYLGYRLIFEASYREERFLAFLDPWRDPLGSGYQYIQALKSFSAGGLFGAGLGRGRQKLNILPEVQTDLILAHIGEELGFIMTIAIIFLYALICLNMFKISRDCPIKFSRIVVLGFAISFSIQAIINMGGELKLLPLTGIPLPLLSSGGTSRIVSLFMIGYSLGASRYRLEETG
ncbi:MAG TPA: FtsW/RodA/SpoVE family cell cycle protein [bacterium]|nr:FtsW/RodA/SpoVE family cell cycle protein [bacterium]HOL55729.1 FtsW/RodA/SpoVE family cell cycle protein [bacterium]HON71881.1 FtsW/RodA/SpoVE family cell cycle protein [bacterium]